MSKKQTNCMLSPSRLEELERVFELLLISEDIKDKAMLFVFRNLSASKKLEMILKRILENARV